MNRKVNEYKRKLKKYIGWDISNYTIWCWDIYPWIKGRVLEICLLNIFWNLQLSKLKGLWVQHVTQQLQIIEIELLYACKIQYRWNKCYQLLLLFAEISHSLQRYQSLTTAIHAQKSYLTLQTVYYLIPQAKMKTTNTSINIKWNIVSITNCHFARSVIPFQVSNEFFSWTPKKWH